jgi:hypothetical protein
MKSFRIPELVHRKSGMTQFVFLTRYLSDQGKSLVKNYWLIPFLASYLGRRVLGFTPGMYVVSYPKSGRTWLRMILINYYSLLLNNGLIDYSILEKLGSKSIVFNHADGSWRPLPKKKESIKVSRRFSNKKVILLVRDPRDILVSNWNHLKFRYDIYRQDLSSFIREDLLGIDKVITFMNLWAESFPKPENLKLVRYEDLISSTPVNIINILKFIGEEPIDLNILKRAIAISSFAQMQKLESRGLRNPYAILSDPEDYRTFKSRKGLVGDWRYQLEPKDTEYLGNKIEKNLNVRFGYTREGVINIDRLHFIGNNDTTGEKK